MRGTYAGLGHPAAIEYLTALGITAVELLPVHQFIHDSHLVERGLRNYWGYNSIGFLAPHNDYSASGQAGGQVQEFKQMVKALHEANIPAVAVATGRPSADVSAVRIDDFAAAQAMTRHLIGLGHRRIGFIKGHPNQTASRQRHEGHLSALADAGVAADDALTVQGYFTYRSGFEGAEQLLALQPPPTAIFASNDDMAAATVAAAHRHGLDVPRDLTVVGFDDSALATTVWPELTTIRQPIADMSRQAVTLLFDEIRSRRAGEKAQHPHALQAFDLIRRDSDAPPKGR